MASKELIERLRSNSVIIAFTGAGVSAESGIATFRDPDGIWAKFKPEELANVSAFLKNPQMVWQWYQARRENVQRAKPNPGHYALAELEKYVNRLVVITQNIDGLHSVAGSKEVIMLHGDIRKNFCQSCKKRFDDELQFLATAENPKCDNCGGLVRPDVVWFGEMLPEKALQTAQELAFRAGVIFSIGTSALVYPAAQIPIIAIENGAYLCEINPDETPLSRYAHEVIREPSGIALPKILEAIKLNQ